jgi:hypothetical protein
MGKARLVGELDGAGNMDRRVHAVAVVAAVVIAMAEARVLPIVVNTWPFTDATCVAGGVGVLSEYKWVPTSRGSVQSESLGGAGGRRIGS